MNNISEENVFPLIASSIHAEEIIAAVDSVLSGQFTMSVKVREFEKKFAEKVGSPFAVMCNSGSSGNLLSFAAVFNKVRASKVKSGCEVLIPAVCWSTSLWPIIQMGLKPVFVDVDPSTLNINIRDLQAKITSNSVAICMVHVLGNTCNMDELMKIVNQHSLVLIEDTCESLGSTYRGKSLGTFGEFGTFSFYFSHHITTGEGGMVTCKTQEDADLLKCLRAHGWSREQTNKESIHAQNPQIDPRFCFINLGYNLRPTEIAGALGLCQLERLDSMNSNRKANRARLLTSIKADCRWESQLMFPEAPANSDPAWFGFVGILHPSMEYLQKDYLEHLSSREIENRPIISGNFITQPAIKTLELECELKDKIFPGADYLGNCGFFIGIHTYPLSEKQIAYLTDSLLDFDFKRECVMVTGGSGIVGSALREYVENSEAEKCRKWIFLSSKDGDLRNLNATDELFRHHKPTKVIHLAVKLMAGGDMVTYGASLLKDNVQIDANDSQIPMSEKDLHAGPCHPSYEAYGCAKRQLEILSRSYRKQYGSNFVTLLPTNILGKKKELRTDGPVVESLIAKAINAKRSNTPFVCRGSGQPIRQFCYAPDLAKVVVWALDSYNDEDPLNIAGPEISIKELAERIASLVGLESDVVYDLSYSDGPMKRTVSVDKLKSIWPEFESTTFAAALESIISELN
ncbi:unnamed protein product [Bathycoccus prasinos]